MGAWSEGIFDNDTALDCLVDMEGIFGIEDIDTEGLSKKHIKTISKIAQDDDTQRKLIVLIREQANKNDQLIAGQAVCSLLMMAGARIAPKLQKIGILCARDNFENWNNPEARKTELAEYKNKIQHYQADQPVIMKSTGLFEKLSSLFKGK